METEEVKNDSEVKVKIKCEERLFKCEDCEAETPKYTHCSLTLRCGRAERLSILDVKSF